MTWAALSPNLLRHSAFSSSRVGIFYTAKIALAPTCAEPGVVLGGKTYGAVWPRLQTRAVNRIVVEAIPLFKRLGSVLLVLVIAPLEHLRGVVNADFLAVHLEDGLGVLQQVIGIDNGDGGAPGPVTVDAVAVRSLVEGLVDRRRVPCLARADDVLRQEVVKQSTQLVVAGLGGHELVEARDGVQGRDSAAVVGGDGAARVADEEGPVEATEHVGRHHGRVFVLVRWAVDKAICVI